jgi:hypothetical protein
VHSDGSSLGDRAAATYSLIRGKTGNAAAFEAG